MKKKKQAFLEFDSPTDANKFLESFKGRFAEAGYDLQVSKHLVVYHGVIKNRRRAIAASRILLITLDGVTSQSKINAYSVANLVRPFATVLRVVVFHRAEGHQALVEVSSLEDASTAAAALHGAQCSLASERLKVEFSSDLEHLSVDRDGESKRDFTRDQNGNPTNFVNGMPAVPANQQVQQMPYQQHPHQMGGYVQQPLFDRRDVASHSSHSSHSATPPPPLMASPPAFNNGYAAPPQPYYAAPAANNYYPYPPPPPMHAQQPQPQAYEAYAYPPPPQTNNNPYSIPVHHPPQQPQQHNNNSGKPLLDNRASVSTRFPETYAPESHYSYAQSQAPRTSAYTAVDGRKSVAASMYRPSSHTPAAQYNTSATAYLPPPPAYDSDFAPPSAPAAGHKPAVSFYMQHNVHMPAPQPSVVPSLVPSDNSNQGGHHNDQHCGYAAAMSYPPQDIPAPAW